MTVSCQDYIALVVGEWQSSMKNWWKDSEGENWSTLRQTCYIATLVKHKCHTDWPMIKPGNPWWEASSFGNVWNIFWRLNIISVLKGIKNCPRISKWTKLTPLVYSLLLHATECVLLHSWIDFIMCQQTMQNAFDVSINKRTHMTVILSNKETQFKDFLFLTNVM